MSKTSPDRSTFSPSTPFRCAGWRVDPELNTATFEGQVRRLGPTQMSLWYALVSYSGRVVSKEELIKTAWHGRCVSDEAVTVAVYELRKLLADRARAPRFIETIPGKGYRWLTEVAFEPVGPLPVSDDGDATGRRYVAALEVAALEDGKPTPVAEDVMVEQAPLGSPRSSRVPMPSSPPSAAAASWSFPWWSRLLIGLLLMWGLAEAAQHRWRVPQPVEKALPSSALDAHLRGLALMREPTPENLEQAMDEFRAVTERVPDHGPSWAAMAEICALLHEYGLGDSADLLARTDATARYALTLEPDHAGAVYAMGLVEMLRFQHWQLAADHFERAVTLDPTFARAWQGLGWTHLAQGDLVTAAKAAERAALLEPRSGHQVHLRVMVFFALEQWPQALQVLDEAETLGVDMSYDLLGLKVAVLQHAGSQQTLWPSYRRMLKALGYSAGYIDEIAQIYEVEGFEGVMAHRLETVPEMPLFWRAVQAMWLGRDAAAMEALEEGVRRQQPVMLVMGVHPAFQDLHGELRFQSLLRRLNL